jgi:hypothetical protein
MAMSSRVSVPSTSVKRRTDGNAGGVMVWDVLAGAFALLSRAWGALTLIVVPAIVERTGT